MSTPEKKRTRKKKRGVTRRVRDAEGNIVTRRYVRRESRFKIPGLTWKKVPSLILGGSFLTYALIAYQYSNDMYRDSVNGDLTFIIQYYFDQVEDLFAILLFGTITVGILTLFGYALVTKGFKIRRWGGAFRQVVAIFAAYLVLSAIISPFFTEPSVIRQESDDEFDPDNRDFNLEGLSSPFYQELLDGLMDLLGNIPDPDLIVANVTPADGVPFDPNEDHYLWRWQVADTYEDGTFEYIQEYPDRTMNYQKTTESNFSVGDTYRKFRVSEQYLTLTSTYSGIALTPWNSESGALISPEEDYSYDINPAGDITKIRLARDFNEQPVYTMNLDSSGTSGAVVYDTYWLQENKEAIASNSSTMEDLASELDYVPEDRFATGFGGALQIDEVWGEKSLLGGDTGQAYADADDFGSFKTQYEAFVSTFPRETTSVYTMALMVNNYITNAVLTNLGGSLNLDPTSAESSAGAADKAYYFWDAIEKGNSFGMEDLTAGFVNMLRALGIPARPVLGFSVGDVEPDQIQIRLEHLHVWIEVLIPWEDENGRHFSWGIFNPFPDPYLLNQGLIYGKNALGGDPDIQLDITTGDVQNLPETIEGRDTVLIQELDKPTLARTRISYDDIPTPSQRVTMKLLTEQDLATGGFDAETGYNLGEVLTDGTDAWGDLNLTVNRDKTFYRTFSNGTVWNLTREHDLQIQKLNPLGTTGTYNVYALVAIYGLSYSFQIIAWNDNANMTMDLDLSTYEIPYNLETVDAGAVIPLEDFVSTIRVYDQQNQSISDEGPIDFIVMDKNEFSTVSDQFKSGNIPNLTPYTEGTFDFTDSNGQSSFTYNFELTDTTDEIYTIMAHIRDTLVFATAFVYLSDEVSFDSSLNTHNFGTVIDTSDNTTYHIESNAIELDGPFGISYGFPSRPAANVTLNYYVIEKGLFELSYYGETYTFLNTLISSPACLNEPGDAECFFIDPDFVGSNNFSVAGGLETDSTGFANASITINDASFPVGDYVFVVVSHDYEYYTNTSSFSLSSAPVFGGFSEDHSLSIPIFEDDTERDTLVSSKFGTDEQNGYSPLVIVLLGSKAWLLFRKEAVK